MLMVLKGCGTVPVCIGRPVEFLILKITCCETLLAIYVIVIVKPKIVYPAVVLKQHPDQRHNLRATSKAKFKIEIDKKIDLRAKLKQGYN